MITDTERLDFIESYLGRQSFIRAKNGAKELVHAWAVVTQRPEDSLRETIDTMMAQKGALQNG